ncbi:MAG: hypothetical protein WCC26_15055 [Terracidiphilus sp.]
MTKAEGVEERRQEETKVGTVVRDIAAEEPAKATASRRTRESESAAVVLEKAGSAGRRPLGSGLQRTVGAIRTVMPLVQTLLPLLDGNVPMALANLLAPRPQAQRADLQALESSVAKMRAELGQLHDGSAAHESALKRIEEQVETVRDALERSAADQKEAADNLHRVQKRVTTLTVFGLLLLAALIAVNVALLVRLGYGLH